MAAERCVAIAARRCVAIAARRRIEIATGRGGAMHTVFFQDRIALAGKLQMMRDLHPSVGGIAIRVMGGEDPAFWDEIALQLP